MKEKEELDQLSGALKGGGVLLPRRNETLHRAGNIFRVLYEGKRKRFQTVRKRSPGFKLALIEPHSHAGFYMGFRNTGGSYV